MSQPPLPDFFGQRSEVQSLQGLRAIGFFSDSPWRPPGRALAGLPAAWAGSLGPGDLGRARRPGRAWAAWAGPRRPSKDGEAGRETGTGHEPRRPAGRRPGRGARAPAGPAGHRVGLWIRPDRPPHPPGAAVGRRQACRRAVRRAAPGSRAGRARRPRP